MPISDVRANIIDIQRDKPDKSDEFLVDTNSWYQLTYSRIVEPKPAYPRYIKIALETGSQLFSCAVTLVELASVIERNEHRIYQHVNPHVDLKMFRHQCAKERGAVVQHIRTCWAQIHSMSQLVALTLDGSAVTKAISSLSTNLVDGYDLLMLQAMDRRGVMNLITDDGDFASVPDINVFTANDHMIKVAKRQGKLRRRG